MKLYPVVLLLLTFIGCQSNQSNTVDTNKTDTDKTESVQLDSGLVTQMEDTGYPMFAMDLKKHDSDKNHSFLLNIEELNLKHEEAYNLKGHNAIVEYVLKHEPFVMDIVHKDTSILGEYALPNRGDFVFITGFISGANEISQGDLPGEFKVTDANGQSISFEYYIDENLSDINGDTATVYFEMMDISVAKTIELQNE